MRFFLLPVILLISVTLCGQTNDEIDVLHYSFRLHLSDASDIIAGKAIIKVTFKKTLRSFSLDLQSVKNGKGMTVSSVSNNGEQLLFTHANDKILITLPQNVKNGDSSVFVVDYSGIPGDGLIIARNKYGHRTFFSDNWPTRAHSWIPCNDLPGDKASVEFIVVAPQHYQVVSNGIQVEETNISATEKLTHWQEEQPVPTKVMVVGVADFAVNLAGIVDCIPVYSWVYPEDREKGFYDYALAKDILPFFIKNVGPYGYKKLANVQSKTTYGGLENASAIFYYENSVTGTRVKEDLLAHEIAHQWFGDMATEKTFAHVWLSEGFATYFTILYFENKYGADTARYMREEDRRQVITFCTRDNNPVVNETVTDYMQLLTANSYQKGGWVLHMLRHQLGDSVFWRGVREYYATYAGKNADTDDLRNVFENVSGKKLETFFRQWLYTPKQPILDVSWKINKSRQLFITVAQQQLVSFTFPLEIKITTASGKTRIEKLVVSQKKQAFTLNNKEAVIGIDADPDVNLLAEIVVRKEN